MNRYTLTDVLYTCKDFQLNIKVELQLYNAKYEAQYHIKESSNENILKSFWIFSLPAPWTAFIQKYQDSVSFIFKKLIGGVFTFLRLLRIRSVNFTLRDQLVVMLLF